MGRSRHLWIVFNNCGMLWTFFDQSGLLWIVIEFFGTLGRCGPGSEIVYISCKMNVIYLLI